VTKPAAVALPARIKDISGSHPDSCPSGTGIISPEVKRLERKAGRSFSSKQGPRICRAIPPLPIHGVANWTWRQHYVMPETIQLTPWPSVRKRTVPTFDCRWSAKFSATFCGQRCRVVSAPEPPRPLILVF
jgi:hypothetical protein